MKKLLTFLMFFLLASTHLWAAGKTGTIKFGTNDVKINAASVTGDDDLGNTWTITTTGTTSFTTNSAYYQVGSSSKPATSITFTTTLSEGVTIKKMSAKFGGFSETAGAVTLKVGDTSIGTGNLNAANDVTVSSSTSTVTGTVLTVTLTGIAKGVKVYNISYTYDDGNSSDPVDASWGVNPASVSVKATKTATAQITTNYDGELIAETNDANVATCSYDDESKVLTVKGVKVGSTKITFLGDATSNYNEIEKEINVTVTENEVNPGTYDITPNNVFFNCNAFTTKPKDFTSATGTQDDITITYNLNGASSAYINTAQCRTYPKNQLLFSVPEGFEITGIVFTVDGTYWGTTETTKPTASVGEMTESSKYKNWAGSSKDVTITFNVNSRINSISVTYIKAAEETTITFAENALAKYVGEPNFTNSATLKKKATGETIEGDITYSCKETAIANVNATGEVTLGRTTGTATITATYEGNSQYKGSTASYTIDLKELPAPTFSIASESKVVRETPVSISAGDESPDGTTLTYKIGDGQEQNYSGPIKITEACTITAYANYNGAKSEAVAKYKITYTVSINECTNGSVTVDKTSAAEGETVTLTVNPAEHYHLETLKWNGNNATKVSETEYTFTMPAEDVTVDAEFVQDEKYTVTWSVNGVEMVDSQKYYANETTTTPVIDNVGGYTFKGWSTSTIETPAPSATYEETPVVTSGDVTYYAVFAKETQGEDVTVTLDATNLKTASYNEGTKKDDKNNTWSYYASINNQSGTFCFGLNSKENYNYNIGSPEFSGNITAISLKAYNGSSKDTRKLLICSSNETAQPDKGDIAEITVSASEQFKNTYDANLTNAGNFKQFYIYAQAALGVSEVKVTYSTKSYSGYCTTLSEVAPLASLETTTAKDMAVQIDTELEVVYKQGNTVWAKDKGKSTSYNLSTPAEGAIDYLGLFGTTYKTAEQNNWIRLEFDSEKFDIEKDIEKDIDAGVKLSMVKGVYNGAPNEKHVLTVSDYTLTGGEKGNYDVNVYVPANFMGNANQVSTVNGNTYFFVAPKVEEYCRVTMAVWNESKKIFTVPATDNGMNSANIQGALNPDFSMLSEEKKKTLKNNDAYSFMGVVTKVTKDPAQSNAPAKVISAQDATPTDYVFVITEYYDNDNNVVTGVEDLNVSRVNGSKAVKMIENGRVVIIKDGKKFNIMGQPVL